MPLTTLVYGLSVFQEFFWLTRLYIQHVVYKASIQSYVALSARARSRSKTRVLLMEKGIHNIGVDGISCWYP